MELAVESETVPVLVAALEKKKKRSIVLNVVLLLKGLFPAFPTRVLIFTFIWLGAVK